MFPTRQNHFIYFFNLFFTRQKQDKNLSVATDKFSCVDFAYPL